MDRQDDRAGPVKSAPAEPDAPIRPVSPNRYRFRTGRWGVVGESVVLVGLGAAGLAAAWLGPEPGPTGATVGVLHITLVHAIVLLATGLLGLVCAWSRWSALVFVTLQTVAYVLLFVVGMSLAARGIPTAVGFDDRDAVLHGAVAVIGLALGMWLSGQALEGRWWVRR